MRKKLLIIVLASAICFSWFKGYFFTFNGIKAEFYEEPVSSPKGTYTAETYYEYYGGAAGGVNVVVEVKNSDGDARVIYYADALNTVYVKWEDDETLYIQNKKSQNRSIKLNVTNEIYHDTGRACRSLLLKGTYTSCYSHDEI